MREQILFPYFADLETLPGLGKKTLPALTALVGGERVIDLLLHLPTRWIDRQPTGSVANAIVGEIATLKIWVDSVAPAKGSAPARIIVRDETSKLTLAFFHARPEWLRRTFPLKATRIVSGLLEEFRGELQILHPDHVINPEYDPPIPPAEPHYRLRSGITLRALSKWIAAALDSVPNLPEWNHPSLLQKQDWPAFREALCILHQPRTLDEPAFAHARARLAHDEALAREIAIARSRRAHNTAQASALPVADAVCKRLYAALSFTPTPAQNRAIAEISADLSRARPMRRMLQGDVGSGKTLVAALAIAQTAHAGFASVIMSPSEILARQQAQILDTFLRPAGFACAALTGRDKGSARKAILERFASGETQALSGTQALFRHGGPGFEKLGLAIIDEQHRFGVADRVKLAATGETGHASTPHILVMSATPIPRTLAMALHGDLDMSVLDEKPTGRQSVTTRAVPDTRLPQVLDAIVQATRRGEKAFWVCPALDSEAAEDAAAIARHESLSTMLSRSPALVHGRMPALKRDAALDAFRSGESDVLVATSVVEVGIDVPDATIMVVECAERFGLAQLHQLRGRVGRSEAASCCLLVYTPPLNAGAEARIRALRETDDGFAIAEMDFQLRGPGDLLGVKQSGLPDFQVLDLTRDTALLAQARETAQTLVATDAAMSDEREKALRILRELLAPGLRQ